jgi:TonB-linked SusC/RagA family outer membrane protein
MEEFFTRIRITNILLLLLCCISFTALAQQKVQGVVIDENGTPIPGVAVILKNTTTGTVTDLNGRYTLNISEGAEVLTFSYIGYASQDVEINNQSTINISLQPNVETLEEVVIVGYGEQKKQSVVAAISQTEGEELLKTGTTQSVSQSLQGMMPGLTVINSDGLPGKGAHEIQIRGVGTTGNSSPLTIVDGVERSIHDVDPNEIETISVLKDASATAVYGVRGANGVIMITTKRGKAGKPEFNFSATVGFKKPTKNIDHVDYITTMEMFNEASINDGRWDNLIPESKINAWKENIHRAGPYNEYFPQIDWWNELIKDYGPQQQYNLSTRGGTKKMRYFVSLGYLNEGDIFNTDYGDKSDFNSNFGFKRYNWRSNFDFDLTKSTQFSISFAGNSRARTQPVFGPTVNYVFSNLRTVPTNVFPIKYSDGEWGDSPTGGDNFLSIFNDGGQEIFKTYNGFYDATLKQDLDFITKGLSFESKLSYTSGSDYYSSQYTDRSGNPSLSLYGTVRYYREFDYTDPIEGPDGTIQYPVIDEARFPSEDYQGGRPTRANYDEFHGYNRQLFYQFSTNYKRKFGKHAVTGLVLMNRQNEMAAYTNVNFEFPSYREDWVGRVTYNYNDKYLFEANGAYTGSEKFAQGKRFGFFPSWSVGWVLSEESFVKDFAGNVLDFLKVRYSNGKMGSDRGAPRFAYMQMYTTRGNVSFGHQNLTAYGPLYYEGRAANPDQTWETSYKENLGVDFDLFDKISATVELYKERREGILMGLRTVPLWFGAQEPSGNIGRTKNRGYEIALGWNDKIGRDFNYYIKANLTQWESRILFYDDPRLQDGYMKHAGKPVRWDRNAPRLINSGYYSSLDDIYNHSSATHGLSMDKLVPGDLMFVDYNANGVTDNQDEVVMKNQLYPKTIFGLNLGFNYKNISLNAMIYGVSDVGRTIGGAVLWDFDNGNVMAHSDVAIRWTPATAATAEKPALHIDNAHNKSRSTYQYVDGSYVRLESVEVSYQLQPAVLSLFGINRIRLFANGSDLLTWTKVDTRVDPEAFGANTYPVVKRYNLGLRASF